MTLRTGPFDWDAQTETSSPDLLKPSDGPLASDLLVCEPGLPSFTAELNLAATEIR